MTRLVIANRGEIARRILRSARARGMKVAAVSTPADARSLVRREVDAVLEVPSFLDAPGVVAAARRWRADLLHPGYGYLSESAPFAAAVEAAGIRFVGPSAESMRSLGGKESARTLAAALGVPTLPTLASAELASLAAADWPSALSARGIEAPYLVKAAAGGGGRGMRLVADPADLEAAVARASEEARAAFADGTVFVERLLEAPRHVEIQVFGDGEGGGVFWGERECSVQRRHQKLFEEAPSPAVGPALREQLGRAALALVRATRYAGAGTVEFLLNGGDRFYFLEVNTRLQVEHPVTEMVYGIDLVSAQLDLAEGRWPAAFPDPRRFVVPMPEGHAFEARILAEDPDRDFLPAPGLVRRYREPKGDGVRVDSGIGAGSEITTAFDSLLAKLIVHGPDRATALDRMEAALEDFVIHGCGTNVSFLHALALHPDVHAGRCDTRWIDTNKEEMRTGHVPPGLRRLLGSPQAGLAIAAALEVAGQESAEHVVRLARQRQAFPSLAGVARLRATPPDPEGRLRLSGPLLRGALADGGMPDRLCPRSLRGLMAEMQERSEAELPLTATRLSPSEIALSAWGETWRVADPRAGPGASAAAAAGSRVDAPMAGKVIEVRVARGDSVEEGQVLFVVESMKMQLEVRSPSAGVVRDVLVEVEDVLKGPDPLAVVSPASEHAAGAKGA